MCMTIGHHGQTFGFVATDTRHFLTGPDRDEAKGFYEDYDPGRKIVSTGTGWAAASGQLPHGAEALAAVRGLHSARNGANPVQVAGARLVEAFEAAGLDPEPPADDYDGSSLVGIEPYRGRVGTLIFRNARYQPAGEVVCAWPYGIRDTPQENPNTLHQAMTEEFDAAVPLLPHRIRVAARWFVKVKYSGSISDVLEVGWIVPGVARGFIRGKAAEIAEASPHDLLFQFRAKCSNLVAGEYVAGESHRGTPVHMRGSHLTDGKVSKVRKSSGDVDVDDVFDVGNDAADRIPYVGGAETVEDLKPAEAGAEQNPPALSNLSLGVTDNTASGDDVYSVSWDYSSAVTGSFTVTIEYFRAGVKVATDTGITATDGAKIHTDTGAGDGVSDEHHVEAYLFNGSSELVQTIRSATVNSNVI